MTNRTNDLPASTPLTDALRLLADILDADALTDSAIDDILEPLIDASDDAELPIALADFIRAITDL